MRGNYCAYLPVVCNKSRTMMRVDTAIIIGKPSLHYFFVTTTLFSRHINTKQKKEEEFTEMWKKKWEKIKAGYQTSAEVGSAERTEALQWFPGHMYKASKEINTILSKGDISLLLEIRDARVCILFFLDINIHHNMSIL